MSRSLAAGRRQQEDNAVGLPLIGEARSSQRAVNAVDLSRGQWLMDALRDAIQSAYSHKAASIDMGIDKAQLSRQLDGDGHLSLPRVAVLPPEVLCAWADRIRAHYGVDDRPSRVQMAMELIERGKSMLAAEVSR